MRPHKYFKAEPEAVKTYGLREVCQGSAAGKREYKARTTEMWLRQEGICPICNLWVDQNEATFEHQEPRRMGGGFTDDRTIIDGEWHNAAAHGHCNTEKGSKRYQWVDGKYVSVLSREREVA